MTKSKARIAGFAGAALLVLAGLFLAGCGGSGEPREYNATVRENYVKGCELAIRDDPQVREGKVVCECAYEDIEDNVIFEEFKRIDDELRENINALDQADQDDTIDEIRGYVRTCINEHSTAS